MNFLAFLASGAFSGIITPFTNMATAIFTKKEDTKIEEGKQDVQVIQSRNTLLGQIHADPAIAFGWYGFIVPTCVWYWCIIVYCIVRPWYPTWKVVLALPPNIEYIPWAVVAFLFGLSFRGNNGR